MAPVDVVLQGGLPRGKLVEVVGEAGRMALSLGALAGATRQGLLAAFVDAADALDPAEAQRRGVDLRRLLWVRPRSAPDAIRVADLLVQDDGFGVVVVYLCGVEPPRRMDHAWLRLKQRCERAGTSLLVIGDRALAGSVAVASLAIEPAGAAWQRAPGGRAVLRGQAVRIRVVRSRLGAEGADHPIELLR